MAQSQSKKRQVIGQYGDEDEKSGVNFELTINEAIDLVLKDKDYASRASELEALRTKVLARLDADDDPLFPLLQDLFDDQDVDDDGEAEDMWYTDEEEGIEEEDRFTPEEARLLRYIFESKILSLGSTSLSREMLFFQANYLKKKAVRRWNQYQFKTFICEIHYMQNECCSNYSFAEMVTMVMNMKKELGFFGLC